MLCACWLYRSYRLVGRSRVGVRRRNLLSPPPAITHQILGHGGSHFEPKDSVSVERILPLARKLNHTFLLRRHGNLGLARSIFHSAIAEFATLRGPISRLPTASVPLQVKNSYNAYGISVDRLPTNHLFRNNLSKYRLTCEESEFLITASWYL